MSGNCFGPESVAEGLGTYHCPFVYLELRMLRLQVFLTDRSCERQPPLFEAVGLS